MKFNEFWTALCKKTSGGFESQTLAQKHPFTATYTSGKIMVKVGNTKVDIFVRISGASFEMKTKKGRGGETKSYEYFRLQDLLQAVAKIFAYEMSNKIKSK